MSVMSAMDRQTLLAMLAWQVELGADEAIAEAPLDRFDLDPDPGPALRASPAPATPQAAPPIAPPPKPAPIDPVVLAEQAAQNAHDLSGLAAEMAGFEHSPLKGGAHNFVFSDGRPEARVMIIGEAPGREEDRAGKPFVGKAGQLLDRMFAAIGLTRQHPDASKALYITNVLPWRPEGNRTPEPAEIALFRPFLLRHIALADPDVLVVMGNPACEAVLHQRGITKLRGHWHEAANKPVMPMLHPAYLLRTPAAKRQAWSDLLRLSAFLDGEPHD